MRVSFTKMHGAGNDFVVFDGVRQRIALTPEKIRRLADRRYGGVGRNQVLIVELRPATAGADFPATAFSTPTAARWSNAATARCFGRFVRDQGLTDKRRDCGRDLGGLIRPRLEPDGEVSVNMGVPRFEPREVPFEGRPRTALRPRRGRTDGAGERAVHGQPACGADGAGRGCGAGEHPGPRSSATRAFEAGERRLHADRGPAPHPPAGVERGVGETGAAAAVPRSWPVANGACLMIL